jgi:hypothetical protein
VAIAATAARLACLLAILVVAPQQPKAAAKAKEFMLEEEAAKAAANRWKQWTKHSDEQQSTSNQLDNCNHVMPAL